MSSFEFVELGSAKLHPTSKLLTIRAFNPITNDTDDVEEFGDCDYFSQLGVTAMNYPKTASGFAQGFLVRDAAGAEGVILGARDSRAAGIVGNLKPGDTVLHSTGPEQAAQVQCKEKKRQVVLATKTSDGKSAMLVLDGTKDTATLAFNGAAVQITSAGELLMANKDGKAGIATEGTQIKLLGQVVLGGGGAAGLPVLLGASAGPGVPATMVVASLWLLGALAILAAAYRVVGGTDEPVHVRDSAAEPAYSRAAELPSVAPVVRDPGRRPARTSSAPAVQPANPGPAYVPATVAAVRNP